MTAEALAIIASYFLCSVAAEDRVLDGLEIDTCTARYIEVKLNFVDGVTGTDYYSLTAKERAVANMAGYEGYVEWQAEHPDLVGQMMNEARQLLKQRSGL